MCFVGAAVDQHQPVVSLGCPHQPGCGSPSTRRWAVVSQHYSAASWLSCQPTSVRRDLFRTIERMLGGEWGGTTERMLPEQNERGSGSLAQVDMSAEAVERLDEGEPDGRQCHVCRREHATGGGKASRWA